MDKIDLDLNKKYVNRNVNNHLVVARKNIVDEVYVVFGDSSEVDRERAINALTIAYTIRLG